MLAAIAIALLLQQPANAQTATISSVSVSAITQQGAKATVTIANPSAGTTTVYLRLRVRGTTAWFVLPEAEASGSSIDIDFQHAGPDTAYEVEASLDHTFLTRVARTTFSSPRASMVFAALGVGDIEQTEAVASITINKPETDTFVVYGRIRQVGTTAWTQLLIPPSVMSTIEVSVDNLMPATAYVLQASTDESFRGGQSKHVRFQTLPPDVESLAIGTPGQTTLNLNANLTASDPVRVAVYLRFRVVGTSQWLYAQAESNHDINNRDVALASLYAMTSGRDYELEASTYPNFPSDRTVTDTFTTAPPSIRGVDADGVTQTRATITAVIRAPNGDRQTVYAQYRAVGDPNWTGLPSRTTSSGSTAWRLEGLTSGTEIEIQASFDDTFPQTVTVSGEFTTAPPSIGSVKVDRSTVMTTSAEVAVAIVEPNGDNQTINVQYRTSFERTWIDGDVAASTTESAIATLSGLAPKTEYQVRVSLDPDFPYDVTKTTSFTTDPLLPSVVSVYVKSVSTSVVDIVTTVDDPSSAVPVLLRYREAASQQWSNTITGPRGRERWERRITGLTTGVEHEVQVSTDSAFASQPTQSVTFSTLQADPTLSSVTVNGVTMTEATATVRIASPSGTETVHVRHREAPSGSWSSTQTETTDTGEVSFTLSGLTPGRDYQVQAAQALNFPDTDTMFAAFTTEQPTPEILSVTVEVVTRTKVAGTVVFANAGTEQNYVTIGAQPPGGQRWLIGVQFASDANTALWEFSRVGGAALITDNEYNLYALAGRNTYTGDLLAEDLQGTFTTLPPAVTAVDVRDVGHTSATLRLAIEDPNGRSYPVALRYREEGETAWTQVMDVATDSSSVTVELTELTAGAMFEVQTSIDSAYAEELTATATVSTLPYKPENIQLFSAGPREVRLIINLLSYNSDIGPQLSTRVRYRRVSSQGPWHTLESLAPFPNPRGASFNYDIRGLDPDSVYEVQASSDERFSRDRTESLRFSTLLPTVSTIDVVNPTLSGATLELLLQGTDSKSRTVYVRYRAAVSETRWTKGPRVSTSTDTATLALTNLRAGADYEVAASLYSNFPANATTTTTLTTASARMEGFRFKGTGQAETVLDADLAGHSLHAVPVYYRYRTVPSGVWSPVYVEIANTKGTKTRFESRLSVLTSGTGYELQVSTDLTFPEADTLALGFITLPPTLASLAPGIAFPTQVNLTATITAPNGTPQTVYLQYRERGTGTWTDLQEIVTAAATGSHLLHGLRTNTTYDLRASLSEEFPHGETVTANVVTDFADFVSVEVSDVTQTAVEFTITLEGPIGGAQPVLVELSPLDETRNIIARTSFSMDTLTSTVRLSPLQPATTYFAYISSRDPHRIASAAEFFDTLPPDPALTLVYADNVTENSADVTTVVNNRYGRTPTVHLRHRVASETDWEPTTSQSATAEEVMFPLPGLDPGVRHDVQVSLEPDFPPGDTTALSFTTLQTTPSLISLTIDNIMQSSAEATISITSPSGTEQVHLRYRQLPSGRQGRTPPTSTDTGTAEFPLSGLAPGAWYLIEASLNSSFPPTDTRTMVIATLPPSPTIGRLTLYVRSGFDITFDAHFANGGTDEKTVYVRHREAGTREWDPRVFTETTTAEDKIRLQPDGLQPDTPYEFQVSLDEHFPSGATASIARPTAGARIIGPDLSSPGPNSIDITATVRFASFEDQPVYTRYRELPSGRWVDAPIVKVDNPTSTREVMVDYTVTGLPAGKPYEIEFSAQIDDRFRRTWAFTTQPPTVSGVQVHQKSQRDVRVRVSTKDINAGVTVYMRHRHGSTPWLHLSPADVQPGHIFEFQLDGLLPGEEYELQASFDSSFPQAGTKSLAFSTLADIPSIESLTESSVTKETAKAVVNVHSPDDTEQEVHLRWQELGASTWMVLTPQTTTTLTTTFELTGLQEDTLYEMEAALGAGFGAATALSQVFATRGGSTSSTTGGGSGGGGGGGGGGGFGPAPVAPKFGDGFRTTRSLAQNARPGDSVGDPVAATHPDDLEITYSLSGTDAASFTVDEETGQIRIKEGVALELGRTYTVNLTATDSAGFGAIIIVVVEVVEATHHPYDANRNGRIDRDEVIAAVKDYFDGETTKEEVIELIKLYFAG